MHPALCSLLQNSVWSSALQVPASLERDKGKGSLQSDKVLLVEMEWLLPQWLKPVLIASPNDWEISYW